jgi:integrase/recombinase XerD
MSGWRDIIMENRSVRIHGKGGKLRVLPLMKGTLAALKDYLALRRSLLRGPDDGVLLLGKTMGKPLSEVMIYPLLRSITVDENDRSIIRSQSVCCP